MTEPETAERRDSSLVNVFSGQGVSGFDPRTGTSICNGQQLSKAEIDRLMRWEWGCREHVVGLPNSATRKWIRLEVEAKRRDASKLILDRLETWHSKERVREALVLERQYGGSGIVIGADDGHDMDEELDLGSLKDVHYLYAVSRWKLLINFDDLEQDPASPRFGMPNSYTLADVDLGNSSLKIHHSRLIIFQGWSPMERQRRYDWGYSVLEPFYPTWRDYSTSLSHGVGMAGRVNETRLKLKGLMEMMKSGEWENIRNRIQEAAVLRSVYKYTLVDSEDAIEDASVEFSGAASIISMARENVAGASGRSLQSFFGLTREGLSDRDEGASERDDAAVTAYQGDHLLQPCNRLVELALAVERIRVKSWQVRFAPLREEAPSAQATRRYTEAQTGEVLANLGAITSNEIREGLRADPENPYPLQEGAIEDQELETEAVDPELDEDGNPIEPEVDPNAEPVDPDASNAEVGVATDIQKQVLNGAQVTSMIELVEATTAGRLSRESASSILQAAFGFTPEVANSVLGPIGFEPNQPEPPPSPFGQKPPPPPAEKPESEEEKETSVDR